MSSVLNGIIVQYFVWLTAMFSTWHNAVSCKPCCIFPHLLFNWMLQAYIYRRKDQLCQRICEVLVCVLRTMFWLLPMDHTTCVLSVQSSQMKLSHWWVAETTDRCIDNNVLVFIKYYCSTVLRFKICKMPGFDLIIIMAMACMQQ